MEQKESRSAAVIMLRGHGQERLRQAIQQGLVRKELEEDFQEVLRQIDDLKTRTAFDRHEIDRLRKQLNDYKGVYFEALRAKQREDARKKRLNSAKSLGLGLGIIFLMMFACVILCRLIFG